MKTMLSILLIAGAVLAGDSDKAAPLNDGKTYTVSDVKAHQKDLDGKVIRLRIFNTGAEPEQQADGSFSLIVAGKAGDEYVIFPPEGGAYIKTFQKSNQGQMTFFALVHFDKPATIMGRGYDPRKKAFTW
jgi:hypothetical protein